MYIIQIIRIGAVQDLIELNWVTWILSLVILDLKATTNLKNSTASLYLFYFWTYWG
jgi:hypothetical protein